MSSQLEEVFLDHFIMGKLKEQGQPPAAVDFQDPDTIIAVETIGQKAGLSFWTREQLQRYPFLKMD
jgi:tRNA(Ser,Leu) C12 N-acetylase TAN1